MIAILNLFKLGVATTLQGSNHLLTYGFSPLVKLHVCPIQLLGHPSGLMLHVLGHNVFLKYYLLQTEVSFLHYQGLGDIPAIEPGRGFITFELWYLPHQSQHAHGQGKSSRHVRQGCQDFSTCSSWRAISGKRVLKVVIYASIDGKIALITRQSIEQEALCDQFARLTLALLSPNG